LKKHRFAELDSLRFFFASAVVAGHTVGWESSVPKGYLAVDFFFLLSGFVLTHFIVEATPTYLRFAANRIARLVPLHLLSLIFFAAVLKFAWSAPINGLDLLWNAALLTFVAPSAQIFNWPAWSIATELVWNIALFHFIVSRRLILPAAAIVSIIVVFAIMGSIVWTAEFPSPFQQNFRCVFGLMAGYLTYEMHVQMRTPQFRKSKISALFSGISMLLLAVFLFGPPWNLLNLATILVMPVVILSVTAKPNAVASLLAMRPLPYLGELSFSIYLLHAPLLMWFRAHNLLVYAPDKGFAGNGVQLAAFFAILLVISMLSFTWFEQPSKRFVTRALLRQKRASTSVQG
jgi:peptidoglycan/LPS O-acetylase OafA/YrhL